MDAQIETQIEPFLAALQNRDRGADGLFFYAVKTTGVYCLPSCAAKNPRPENVAYYATAESAEAAGYRPCKRCRPNDADRDAGLIAAACRAIETAETAPDLAALAAAAQLSPSHFHRLFRKTTGVTPKAYAAEKRAEKTKAALKTAKTVTEAIYDSGHGGASRFHATATASLGMTPKDFRSGGAGQEIFYAVAPCALGLVLAARTKTGICAIFLGDDETELAASLAKTFPKADIARAENDFLGDVVAAIAAPARAQNLPLDIAGTAFQRQVFEALRAIPPGETATYSQIAAKIGAPKAVRAVASACAANRLAVAIPCHRAVRADGALAGYRWGLARKQKLLEAEQNA